MKKTLHTLEAKEVTKLIRELRKEARLTQRQLAALLKIHPSEVHKMETRERRLDVIQFYFLCRALELVPTRVARRLFRMFDTVQKTRSRS